MKLNLGCGDKRLEGFVNVDSSSASQADIIHDLRLPLPVADGTVSEIYAKHIIEHFTRTEWGGILADWARVLTPGGTLVIEAPDMVRLTQCINSDLFGRRKMWETMLFGADGPGMRHQRGVTIPDLRSELEAAGLTVTRARPWHDDFQEHINDPLWHYNLRVEAVKP